MSHSTAYQTQNCTYLYPTIEMQLWNVTGTVTNETSIGGFQNINTLALGSYLSESFESGTNVYGGFFWEFNISSIPSGSHIENVSLLHNGVAILNAVGPHGVLLCPAITKINETSSKEIWYSFVKANIGATTEYFGAWYPATTAGGALGNPGFVNHSNAIYPNLWKTYVADTPRTRISKSLEGNLSRGWFGLGCYLFSLNGVGSQYQKISNILDTHADFSLQNTSLFITYSYTCPDINWTNPANGQTDVNLSFLNLQFNLSHPFSTRMNYTVFWHNYTTGNFEPIASGTNVSNGTYSAFLYNATFFNTFYEWRVNASEYYNVSYLSYNLSITINHNYVLETLKNFPVLVSNTSSLFLDTNHGGYIQPNGSDISFWNVAGTTRYAHELEYYNGSVGRIVAWVNVTTVRSDVDTVILMRANGTSLSCEDSTKVWDGFYKAVYHFNGTNKFSNNTNISTLWDSSGNGNHLTQVFSTHTVDLQNPENSTSKLGYSYSWKDAGLEYFKGSNAVDDNLNASFSNFTIESSWRTFENTAATKRIVDKYLAGQGGFIYAFESNGDRELWFDVITDGATEEALASPLINTGADNNAWRYSWGSRIARSTYVGINQTWFGTATDAQLGSVSAYKNITVGGKAGDTIFQFTDIDEVRISIGNGTGIGGSGARNESWESAVYNNTNNFSTFMSFGNWIGLDSYTFGWSGGQDNKTSQTFSFTTFDVEPPTNVTATAYNASAVNITFTEFPNHNGTTNTVCYYQQGYELVAYGEGTLAGNTTNETINVTGLTSEIPYTFVFWTYWNDTHGMGMLSLSYTYLVYVSPYGDINFKFRYENSSVDGTNHLINFSVHPNSTHLLRVYSEGYPVQEFYLDAAYFAANGYSNNITATCTHKPTYFDFYWNYSINPACTNITTPGYFRRLTTNSVEKSLSYKNVTFYMIVDKHIYNSYYWLAGVNLTESSISNNLVKLTYSFSDKTTGLFEAGINTTATFFIYNKTKKLVIEDWYWSAENIVKPMLWQTNTYLVGVNASGIYEQYGTAYESIGTVEVTETSGAYPIVINPVTSSLFYITNISMTPYWNDYVTGLSLLYVDPQIQTQWIKFTVYNGTGYVWSKNVSGTNSYLFNYSAAKQDENYTIEVVFKISKNISVIQFPMFPEVNALMMKATFDTMMKNLFGLPPFYNPTTGQQMDWFETSAMMMGLFFFGLFVGFRQIEFGFFVSGFWYIGCGVFVSGTSLMLLSFGSVMILVAVLYLLYKGGVFD